MRHDATRDLFRYWNSIRGERASPDRDEIDPAAIRHVLADTFLLSLQTDGSFRIRLAGTRVDALWLSDQKDRCFLDWWGHDRHSVAAALWTVMDGVAPLVFGATAAPVGRRGVPVEGILLPLRHSGKTHSLVLGAISLAEPPPWIGLMPVDELDLVSIRVVPTPKQTGIPVAKQAVRSRRVNAAEQRGHLTVYAGGR